MTSHGKFRKAVEETYLGKKSLKFNPVNLSLIRQKIQVMLITLSIFFFNGLFCLREQAVWEKPIFSWRVYHVLHLERASNSRNIFASNKFTLIGKVTEDYLKCLRAEMTSQRNHLLRSLVIGYKVLTLKDCAPIMQLFAKNS